MTGFFHSIAGTATRLLLLQSIALVLFTGCGRSYLIVEEEDLLTPSSERANLMIERVVGTNETVQIGSRVNGETSYRLLHFTVRSHDDWDIDAMNGPEVIQIVTGLTEAELRASKPETLREHVTRLPNAGARTSVLGRASSLDPFVEADTAGVIVDTKAPRLLLTAFVAREVSQSRKPVGIIATYHDRVNLHIGRFHRVPYGIVVPLGFAAFLVGMYLGT